jgi:prophage antirepressor-like protein
MVASPDDPGGNRAVERFVFRGNEVRAQIENGEPWWVAADVCAVLELHPGRALARLDEDEKGMRSTHTPGGLQVLSYVNEPGLYSLVLGSRKAQAREFKRWIIHEVIPAIRKTGSYSVAEVSRKDLALMVIQAEEEREALASRVRELEPSAQAWDVLASASGDYSLRDAAFILNRDRAISTGQNRLLRSIRDFDMIDRNGVPYAKHSAHLVERATSYIHPHTNEPVLSKQIRVTVQGLRYLHRKLGGEGTLQLPLPEAG